MNDNERQKDIKHTLPAGFPELPQGDGIVFTHPVILSEGLYSKLVHNDRISVHNDEDDIVRPDGSKNPLYHYILFSDNGIDAMRVSDLSAEDTAALVSAIAAQRTIDASIHDRLAAFAKYIPEGATFTKISFPLDERYRGFPMEGGCSLRDVFISREYSHDGSVTSMNMEYSDADGTVRQKNAGDFTDDEWKEVTDAIEKSRENLKEKPFETPSRWRNAGTALTEVYANYGDLLSCLAENRSGNDVLHVYEYVHAENIENSLMLTIFSALKGGTSKLFLSDKNLEKYGLRANPVKPYLPVAVSTPKGMEVHRMYDIGNTFVTTGPHRGEPGSILYDDINAARNTLQHDVMEGRNKIENIVASGNWPVPLHYADEKERKVLESYPSRSAFYDIGGGMRGHKAVYVLPPGDDNWSDNRRKMDILDALSLSIIDPVSGFLDCHPEYDDNRYNVTHFMNAIRYNINLNVADATLDFRRKPFSQADRLYSDPIYVRELLTKSSMVSQLIADRANGIVYNLHEGERVTEEKGSQKEERVPQEENVFLLDPDEVSKENEQEESQEHSRGLHL